MQGFFWGLWVTAAQVCEWTENSLIVHIKWSNSISMKLLQERESVKTAEWGGPHPASPGRAGLGLGWGLGWGPGSCRWACSVLGVATLPVTMTRWPHAHGKLTRSWGPASGQKLGRGGHGAGHWTSLPQAKPQGPLAVWSENRGASLIPVPAPGDEAPASARCGHSSCPESTEASVPAGRCVGEGGAGQRGLGTPP